jgi:hypothetical protein
VAESGDARICWRAWAARGGRTLYMTIYEYLLDAMAFCVSPQARLTVEIPMSNPHANLRISMQAPQIGGQG